MPNAPSRVLVIGAGITGLCCAHRLAALGLDPLVVEAAPRVGGRMRTVHDGGYEFEAGPNTLLKSGDDLVSLLDELGLEREIVTASPAAKKRYVLLRGRLEEVPMGPIAALTSPLLGPRGVLGALGDLVRRRPTTVAADESVASFVRRRFGARVLDNLVGPFLSGVYAGDPEALEARSVLPMLVEAEEQRGSVIRGLIARRRMAPKRAHKSGSPLGITFNGGLQRLPERIAEVLGPRLRTGAAVASIREDSDGCEVTLQNGERLHVDRVVIATETTTAAQLVQNLPGGGEVARDLSAIPASDVAVVGLGFDKARVRRPLDGFGYLVGPGNTGPVLGCLFRSSIFPGSAPADRVLLTCFLGGALHDIRAISDDQLVKLVRAELADKLEAEGEPDRVFCTRWNQALPQATRGHARRRDRIQAWSRRGRVSIVCSGVYGAPLPKCVSAGRAEAQRLASLDPRASTPSEEQACVPV